MYQKPDFVKVEVDVKENFTGYCSTFKTGMTVSGDNGSIGTPDCNDFNYYNNQKVDVNPFNNLALPSYQCHYGDMDD